MQESQTQTWRTLLGDILKKRGERQRLAGALGINPLTLTRWVNGQSVPRPSHLRQLPTLVSEQHTLLLTLLTKDFPGLSLVAGETDKVSPTISSAFYAEVLQKLATLPVGQSRWSIRKRILAHALEQLDPQQNSVTITLTRCVPPSPGRKVRSVQVMMGVGRPPWGGDLDQQAVFYGVDSVAGRVISSGQPLTIQNFRENTRLSPASNIEGFGSLSVYPLQQDSRIAGTFNVLSSQPEFFLPSCLSLLQQYGDLLAITFPPEDFYALEDIELRLMPIVPLQIPYLISFRERVLQGLKQTAGSQQAMTLTQAELLVWQHIEDELIQLALTNTEREMNHPISSSVAQKE